MDAFCAISALSLSVIHGRKFPGWKNLIVKYKRRERLKYQVFLSDRNFTSLFWGVYKINARFFLPICLQGTFGAKYILFADIISSSFYHNNQFFPWIVTAVWGVFKFSLFQLPSMVTLFWSSGGGCSLIFILSAVVNDHWKITNQELSHL